jgi:dihydroxyacetone kinase-like protein
MACTKEEIAAAMSRAAAALRAEHGRLNDLDQAMGDGDIGITLDKIGEALGEYAANEPMEDIGKWLGKAGMLANKVGSSSFGTLVATALMRGGKAVQGKEALEDDDLVTLFRSAAEGVKERGKANLGDKSVLDTLFPAADAFAASIADGEGVAAAGKSALAAAEAGRDAVTPLQSKIGRGSWVGERTAGLVDPGCEAFVVILGAIAS